jgi:hypothetical protein
LGGVKRVLSPGPFLTAGGGRSYLRDLLALARRLCDDADEALGDLEGSRHGKSLKQLGAPR